MSNQITPVASTDITVYTCFQFSPLSFFTPFDSRFSTPHVQLELICAFADLEARKLLLCKPAS
jgi:hypothetical protein